MKKLNEWISVKDKIPQDNEPVLIYTTKKFPENMKQKTKRIYAVAVYDIYLKNWFTLQDYIENSWLGNSAIDEFVTHWMPLPKQPRWKGE